MARCLPRPLVLCGPSGSGKSTLLKRILEEFPDSFGFSVSHTTRTPRQGEVDGVHYHFISRADFENGLSKGEFIESATYGGNLYGTSKRSLQKVIEAGKVCILDIDLQGVKQIQNTDLQPWCVFLKPPSLKELEIRLRARGTETEESLAQRLETAEKELEFGEKSGKFHLIIENDNLEHAYEQFRAFLVSNVLEPSDSGDAGGKRVTITDTTVTEK